MAAMRFWTPLLLATIIIACKASDTGDGEGQGSAAAGGRCVVNNQITGSPLTQEELSKIDDPIAQLILSTDGCPLTVSQLTAKLRAAHTVNCADQGAGKPATGVTTRMIGEAAAESGKPGSYRTVTARDCNSRPPFGLLMSGTANGNGIGEKFLEIITQDTTKGVFDYYSQENGQWTFFGTSADFVSSGYTCKQGQCTPKIASQTRCAGCHPGGGLNMKELHSPWVMWDVGSLPGAPEAIAKSPDVLGSRGSGVDLEEQRVSPGNQVWAKKRLEILKAKGTQEVLRGLCRRPRMHRAASARSRPTSSSTARSRDRFCRSTMPTTRRCSTRRAPASRAATRTPRSRSSIRSARRKTSSTSRS
jgi:hypothetical protein